MHLEGKFVVGLFDLFLVGFGINAENGVKVGLSINRHVDGSEEVTFD